MCYSKLYPYRGVSPHGKHPQRLSVWSQCKAHMHTLMHLCLCCVSTASHLSEVPCWAASAAGRCAAQAQAPTQCPAASQTARVSAHPASADTMSNNTASDGKKHRSTKATGSLDLIAQQCRPTAVKEDSCSQTHLCPLLSQPKPQPQQPLPLTQHQPLSPPGLHTTIISTASLTSCVCRSSSTTGTKMVAASW